MLQNILDTYSRANDRVTGERTGVQGSSHSGSGLISNGAGFPESRYTHQSVTAEDIHTTYMQGRQTSTIGKLNIICRRVSGVVFTG